MKNIIFTSVLALLLISCSKTDNGADDLLIDCSVLKTALLNLDSELLNSEVNKLTSDLLPNPDTDDSLGHQKNLDTLIERLNSECTAVVATEECYACIETNPVQSEIRVKLDSLGSQVERIIDINTPEDNILKSVGVHL